ncbi:nucleoside-diphosphate-sugar epimerase [Cellulomonas sp. PhB143]|nr:nucleoside-diphosphate-sugar epimerase [Cellulomonas sp. PhB143]
MRVVVVGASGNVGTAVLAALAVEPVVTSLVGVARRVPRAGGASTVDFPHDAASWVRLDVTAGGADDVVDRLAGVMAGADTVVHLVRTPRRRTSARDRRTGDVEAARRVFAAAGRAGVRHVVAASCTGAYAASGGDEPRVESWPVRGGDTSGSAPWARAENADGTSAATDRPMTATAEVERLLVRLSAEHPVVVTSVRSPIVLHRRGASQLVRDVVGRLPSVPLRKDGTVPVVLWPEGLRVQVVHADDLAQAYRRIVVQRQPGAFNIAASDVLDGQTFADVVSGGRLRPIPEQVARMSLSSAKALGVAPVDARWLDTLFDSPVLDTTLARAILHWAPQHDARSALEEIVAGIRDGAGAQTPPLLPLRPTD